MLFPVIIELDSVKTHLDSAEKDLAKSKKVCYEMKCLFRFMVLTCTPIVQVIAKSKTKGDMAAMIERYEEEQAEMQAHRHGMLKNLGEV